MGTAEVENAINLHDTVIESAVVGYPHDIKGQGIYAFVISSGHEDEKKTSVMDILSMSQKILDPLQSLIRYNLWFAQDHSGKIMRQILERLLKERSIS